MTKYSKAAASVKGSPVPVVPQTQCGAPGCQLPGSLTSNTLGASEWFCSLHFAADYASRDAITAKVNNRIAAYRLARRCLNAPLAARIPPQVKAMLEQLGRSDLLRGAKPLAEHKALTARALGMHMLAVLDKECRDVPASPAAAKADSYDSWLSAGELASEVAA